MGHDLPVIREVRLRCRERVNVYRQARRRAFADISLRGIEQRLRGGWS